jgi:hypothetical protein
MAQRLAISGRLSDAEDILQGEVSPARLSATTLGNYYYGHPQMAS